MGDWRMIGIVPMTEARCSRYHDDALEPADDRRAVTLQLQLHSGLHPRLHPGVTLHVTRLLHFQVNFPCLFSLGDKNCMHLIEPRF